jgi:hypothetical protein
MIDYHFISVLDAEKGFYYSKNATKEEYQKYIEQYGDHTTRLQMSDRQSIHYYAYRSEDERSERS